MRYYVTGANGFIGKHVVKYLQDRGHEVIAVKRGVSNHVLQIDTGIEFTFIHLGAYGNHYNQRDIAETITANIKDLYFIIMLCGHPNCRKLYNISTSSIQLPKQTLYSVSKHFGELMVESCNDERFVNIRPYSVYGPGEASHRFIPTVIRALRDNYEIPIDEDSKHDWVFVEDFVEAMFSGYTEIGTGTDYTNRQVVNLLEQIAGKKLLYYNPVNGLRNYDSGNWTCERGRGVPSRSLYDGLKLTYERTP